MLSFIIVSFLSFLLIFILLVFILKEDPYPRGERTRILKKFKFLHKDKKDIPKGLLPKALFIVLPTTANDTTSYSVLNHSNGRKTLSSFSFLEPIDLRQIRNETDQLEAINTIKHTQNQVQTNLGEVHNRTDRIKNVLKSFNQNLLEVEQKSSTMIRMDKKEYERRLDEIRGEISDVKKEVDIVQSKCNGIQDQVQSNFNETDQLRFQHTLDQAKIQTEMRADKRVFENRFGEISDEIHGEISGVKKEVDQILSKLNIVQDQIQLNFNETDQLRFQCNVVESKTLTEMHSNRVVLENGLYETANKISHLEERQRGSADRVEKLEKEIQSDLKIIENKQTEVSNNVTKQENELKSLKINLSGDGRPGKYFYYKLTNVGDFFKGTTSFESQNIFTVKGIY